MHLNGFHLFEINPGYYDTGGSGRLGSFSDYFLAAGFRSGTDRIFPVQFRSESGGKELAGIGENCTGTDSDFNGSSRRIDRPGMQSSSSSRYFRTQSLVSNAISFAWNVKHTMLHGM
ncbi:unnamed protein product [Adineta ricciae]|uniref:Uncharacterized protein n=1 Tax=Adineta ricciae TaxID=249248 RepID=A0A816F7A2_ADIRI|nr:unnamed protein product [Adineta ricciae]